MSLDRVLTSLAMGLGILIAAGCKGTDVASALDATGIVGGAYAAAAPAQGELWKEHAANDSLPQGVVPMGSLAPLVKVLKPGVVNVYTTSVVRPRAGRGQDLFEEFFHRFGGEGSYPESRRQSLGSGFLINSKGYVVTNNHVVEGATEIKVKLFDSQELEAEIVGRDPKTDVALLKLKTGGAELKDPPFVYLGDSDKLEVGEFVVAMGNPFGLDHSVSLGIVSAKERDIGASTYDNFIQTDAAINPGNSGGPLFNTRGEVVGVNTAIVAQGQGIGFAVPINMVKALLPQLLAKGKIVHGWLGVSIQGLTPELARAMKLERSHGALVAGVMKKGPADAAGVKAGDVVVGINGKPIETFFQLSREIAFLTPGSAAQLAILRDGKTKAVQVKIGQRPDDEGSAGAEVERPDAPAGSSDALGIVVQPLDPERATRLAVDHGVQIVRLKPDGAAARAGVRPGDVIVELQGRQTRSLQDYQAALAMVKPGEMALLRLQRGDASVYIAVSVPR